MTDQHDHPSPNDAFENYFNHRPRITYDNVALVFDKAGDLVIEQDDPDFGKGQVTIPEYQIDLILAFIKQHRLDSIQAGLGAAFGRRYKAEYTPSAGG